MLEIKMPKKIDYPLASFKAALEVAKAVKELGGSCNVETCAEKLGKKNSGGFSILVSSTVKFGLVNRKQSQLICTPEYDKYNLSYTPEEETKYLRNFFFNINLFKELYEKYRSVELPVANLDKILIREFHVEEKFGSRVAKYFTEGSKMVGILNQDNKFNDFEESSETVKAELNGKTPAEQTPEKKNLDNSDFRVRIIGPGFDHDIVIHEEEDLSIVDAILKKVRKKLSEDL
jgi:hypothetical protein